MEAMQELTKIIRDRRTRKPIHFRAPVEPSIIVRLLEDARHAPNHHRTEPARFYLLDPERIKQVGNLFGEVVSGFGKLPELFDKADRKAREWGNAPGLLIVTSLTDRNSRLTQKNPRVIEEDCATVCCIVQNLLLLFESSGISAKWSTGPVWEHPNFATTVGLKNPKDERVVALLFYGLSDEQLSPRVLSPPRILSLGRPARRRRTSLGHRFKAIMSNELSS